MNQTPVSEADGSAHARSNPHESVDDTLTRMNTPRARRIDSLVAASEVAREAEHAVKNPLATMVLAVGRIERSLEQSGVPSGLSSAMLHLKEAMDNLGKAMERFRDMSTCPHVELRALDIAGVLESIAGVAAHTTGATIRVEIRTALPLVPLDLAFMERALLGLIWHAIGEGAGGGLVEISAEHDADADADTDAGAGGAVVIRIGRDEPADHSEHLLRPFRHAAPEQFDLGLARHIVDLHHGSLRVAESDGRIASVVTLPGATAEEQA